MRSYGQFCSVAKALDAIGDRWSLLVVRELMVLGPCRYTDLLNGLPGIATNLLADRLRQLEDVDVVSRELAPPPIATTLFRLTPRGEELLPVIRELGRWGAPLLAEASEGEAVRGYWLVLPLDLYYYDPEPDQPPVTIEARMGDEPMVIETAGGKVHGRRGSARDPDAILSGSARLIIGVLSGRLDLEEALRQGLQLDGDPGVLTRVRSASAPPRSTGASAPRP